MKNCQDDNPTKLKILNCAITLFAAKGFTETSMREIALDVGIKTASLYYYFPSKNALLKYVLDDYVGYVGNIFRGKNIYSRLHTDPTPDGIMSCLTLAYPEEKKEYYLKILSVTLQEQYRNPIIRDFVTRQMILSHEIVVKNITDTLKELNIICQDADLDFWIKASSSILYTYASRMLLGIGDTAPEFNGMGMVKLLKFLFELLFFKYGNNPKKG